MDEQKKTSTANQDLNTQIIQQPENSLQAEANDYDIDGFLAKRKEFIEKVNTIMVEKSDYHVIQGKKSLGKGGAEKIASIFGWSASFSKDQDVAEAFNDIKGLISFVCRLQKSGSAVGEGRGAAVLTKNGGDPNKTIKMAQKSAFIDAILRASGLSDFFTQDLEDMNIQNIDPRNTRNGITKDGKTVTFVQQSPQAEYYCETHDRPLILRPAGKTKQSVPYNAFWACTEKTDGKFCKGPFTDTDGNRVKQNPESGKMEVIEKVHQAEVVFNTPEPIGDEKSTRSLPYEAMPAESSVDKARRILNASVPKAPYVEGHEND